MDDWFEGTITELMHDLGIPSRFTDVGALVALAIGCGWRTTGSKALSLIAVDGTPIDLPGNSHLKMAVFRARARTIVRHRATVHGGQGMMNAPVYTLVERIVDNLKLDPDHARALRDA